MYISQETFKQTHQRLLKVIATSTIKVFDGFYSFEEFSLAEFPGKIKSDAVAIIRDDEMWCQLVPATDKASELYKLFRFHFKPNCDNSGFIGWLANHLKTTHGTGVFVTCGQNTDEGGIYDYWGCPIEVADEVLSEVMNLVNEGKRK